MMLENYVDTQILTLCLCPFAAVLMHIVFNFYYVKIFTQNFALDPKWFSWGQIAYMLWNAINDPIFGCWQNARNVGRKKHWWQQRRKVILYLGPFYALSFLLPWFPWGRTSWVVGVHFVTSLFIYDGLFSFVLIGWCSLYAEVTTNHEKRIRAIKYVQVASIIGVNSLPIFEKASKSLTNMAAFQAAAVVVALVAMVCFFVTGKFTTDEDLVSDDAKETTQHSDLRIFLQICKDRDFLAFVSMNFLTIIRTTIHANFTAIFTERLIPQEILPKGSWMISVFYGMLTILPQISVFVFSHLAYKFGTYKIFMTSFACSIVCLSIMGVLGRSFPILIILFMIIDAFKASSIFFGLNALITKPAISLAPLFVIFVLNQSNYEHLITAESRTVANATNISGNLTLVATMDDDLALWRSQVANAMFLLLWTVPLVIGSVQLLVFWKYSLRKTHITQDKDDVDQIEKIQV